MSFFYCIATLLEFAGVHYFTKVGSGEIPVDEEEWEDCEEEDTLMGTPKRDFIPENSVSPSTRSRRKSSLICPIYNVIMTFRDFSSCSCFQFSARNFVYFEGLTI